MRLNICCVLGLFKDNTEVRRETSSGRETTFTARACGLTHDTPMRQGLALSGAPQVKLRHAMHATMTGTNRQEHGSPWAQNCR